jgi:TonB family protein
MKKLHVILIMVLLGSGNVFAQTEACTKAINDGIALFNSGKYVEAKVKFEAAKRINCNDAQSWVNKCNAKLNASANTGKSQKQIQCDQRYKDGKAAYDAGNYEEALIFFKKGLQENCTNVDFEDYIEMCNIKLERKREVEEVIPFAVVEEKPKFQGGDQNTFSKWVNSKINYPVSAQENRVQGRVMIQFIVDKDGYVKNASVIRKVSPDLDREALRVVASSPKWTPGKQGTKNVAVVFQFPVVFQLQ